MKRSLLMRLLPVVLAAGGAAVMVWLGWDGDKTILAGLGVLVVGYSMLTQGNGILLDQALGLQRESLDGWKSESELTLELTLRYLDSLSEMADHDPARAAYHAERLKELLEESYPGVAAQLVWAGEEPSLN